MSPYGWELQLDLQGCDVSLFNRTDIERFFIGLCDKIEMEREDLHFWDYEGVPEEELPTEKHLRGTSAVQFISTSTIVIHTLDLTGNLFVNCFSCKQFKPEVVQDLTEEFFKGKTIKKRFVERLWNERSVDNTDRNRV